MTRSERGTIEKPGRNVRAKSGLNRSILDVAPGRVRRLLEYKAAWSGTKLMVIDRWAPSSKMCSTCGAVKAKLSRGARTFRCKQCNLALDRDVNAAINIAALADAARSTNVPGPSSPGTEEAKNARRAAPRKPVPGTGQQRVTEITGRPARVIFAQ
jgi:putative transposase